MFAKSIRYIPAVLLMFVSVAHAQDSGAQSFDQYPSFIELTTVANDGTQTVLRCGYLINNGVPVLDPNFQEISSINQNRNTYARLQHVAGFVIATSPAPAGKLGLQLELAHPDGTVVAKICETNTETDTIMNCQPANVMEPGTQIMADDRTLGSQCVALLGQGTSQINPAVASPEKTATFMAGLQQKVAILDAK